MKTRYVLAYIASIALVSSCGQQADDTAVDATSTTDTVATPDAGGMVLPATTSSDAARKLYIAGWADFANSRFTSANDNFVEAAAVDPTFAMAHLMAALSSASTEGFVSNLAIASENKAGATRGEQLLVEAFQDALAADTEGWIAALQELTELHPDSPRAWVFLGNAYFNVNDSCRRISILATTS
jgi:Flp pilus assembly protein TadD